MKPEFKIGDTVICINIEPIKTHDKENEIRPPLHLNKEYTVKDIVLDIKKNQHLDVGLKSSFNYIRSVETKEELDRGDEVHWCHPSRFIKTIYLF